MCTGSCLVFVCLDPAAVCLLLLHQTMRCGVIHYSPLPARVSMRAISTSRRPCWCPTLPIASLLSSRGPAPLAPRLRVHRARISAYMRGWKGKHSVNGGESTALRKTVSGGGRDAANSDLRLPEHFFVLALIIRIGLCECSRCNCRSRNITLCHTVLSSLRAFLAFLARSSFSGGTTVQPGTGHRNRRHLLIVAFD